MKTYDLAIIGSGPGGYTAALYASRHKLTVCVLEKDLLGGTCLNRGCIPTKAMLKTAAIFSEIKDASTHGIEVRDYKLNFQKAISRRDEVVSRLRTGIDSLFKANKIDLIKAHAVLTGTNTIRAGATELSAKSIIIATGSKVAGLRGIEFDEERTLSSDGILKMRELPKSLLLVGGGVIGCEFSTMLNLLGVKITIVEVMDRLIPSQSREVSKRLETVFKKRGIEVMTSSKVEQVEKVDALEVRISNGTELEVEKILISVGRIPDTDGIGLEEIGVKRDKSKIIVDENLRTNVRNIYAIGDCIGGPLLAHKASYEGLLACDNILGHARAIDYSNIPSCIYTDPEIASVGLCEEDAKTKYTDARIAKFPYLASGKAHLNGRTDGFVKVIGDSNGSILGVEIFGEGACELIGEATLAKSRGVNIKDWARVVHGHPTLSEMFQEAAHAFCGTPIHSV